MVLDMQAQRVSFFLFVYLEMSLFPSISCTIAVFHSYGEYVVRFFLPEGIFLPCDHRLDFDISLLYVRIQSIKSIPLTAEGPQRARRRQGLADDTSGGYERPCHDRGTVFFLTSDDLLC